MQKWILLLTNAAMAAALCFAFWPARAQAQGPRGDPRDKFLGANVVTIPAGETVTHDLYVYGGTVQIDGRIDGDLFVGGGRVDLTGPVTGDLFAIGGTVVVSGAVQRSLRIVGGDVTVSGEVGRDVVAGAGTLTITPSARITGDVIFAGGTANQAGAISGSVLGSAEAYAPSGRVSGSENVEIRQTRPAVRRAPSLGRRFFGQVRRYLSIVAIGLLLLLLAPAMTRGAARTARRRPLPALAVGIGVFIGFFIVVLALLIGMVAVAVALSALGFGQLVLALVFGVLLAVGALTYVFTLSLLFIAAAVTGIVLGRVGLDRATEPWGQEPYLALLLGVFAIVVLTALPYVGGILNALAVIFGLGGMSLLFLPSQSATAAPAT